MGEEMNILFLTMVNINNINRQNIYSDLLRQFRDKGHNVYVVCPREKRTNLSTEYAIENKVNFLRVKIGNITKTNVVEKGISTLRIENMFLKAIKKYIKNVIFDLVIYSTPPITFEKVIRFIKKKDGAKSYLLLKDIFPQNAVDLNMFSKISPIYWYFRIKEKKLYRNSDYIGCMSLANVNFILKHNPEITLEKVEVCPNSIEPIEIEKNKKRITEIKEKYNIPFDKTVFLYGGNLGKPQGVNFLMECLKANKFNNKVYFVIAGSGTEYTKLENFFHSEKITNAKLFAQLPKDDYEILANSCDVGLIFLDNRFTIPNFPSRLLSYMQASIPVLAATDVNTDIGEVIEEGQFGYWCESNDIEQFNKKVQELCDIKLRKQMGVNARRYLEDNYTANHSYEIIMNHFK
ncbi:glycosyltransferase family 4 protein [Peribacillus frigoritolerans]|uniref:glycosyltransferase family 4 protein n=1 Tax=Peribacillus frigoritolerans TaxID=450367 RepID=UPI0038299177